LFGKTLGDGTAAGGATDGANKQADAPKFAFGTSDLSGGGSLLGRKMFSKPSAVATSDST
jgi:hypothetical protein